MSGPGDTRSPEEGPGQIRLFASALSMAWRAHPQAIAGQLVVTVLTGLIPVASADLIRYVLDDISAHAPAATVLPLVVGLGCASCLAVVLAAVGNYLTGLFGRAMERLALAELYSTTGAMKGLRRLEDPEFQNRLALAQQSGAGGPTQVVSAAFGIAQSVLTLASFLIALAVLNATAALLIVTAAIPAFFAERRVVRHRVAQVTRTSHARRRQFFYSGLLASQAAAKEIRIFGLGGFFTGRMLTELRVVHDSARRLDRRQLTTDSSLAVISAAIAGGGLWWAVSAAIAGRLTVGDVSMFVAALAAVAQSLTGIITSAMSSYQALSMFRCYRLVLTEGPDLPVPDKPAVAPALRNGIEFRDVWFRYNCDGPWALRAISCFLPCGQTTALVGQNGAGKSTLVKLLCRLYDPDRGRILWDGVDLRDVDPDDMRRRISVLFQDFMQYELSVADNIRIGDLSRTDTGALEAAADRAGVHDTIAALPRGYQTMLSRAYYDDAAGQGIRLSGGQSQRVALARMFLRGDRDLVILDEPSSGLDAEAEHQIHQGLQADRNGITMLISHRLNTIRAASQILVIGDGTIIERGDHEDLIGLGGTYARMFEYQAAGYTSVPVAANRRSRAEPTAAAS